MTSSKALITNNYLTDIASAIRAKNGLSTTYLPFQMASAITDIPSGGGVELITKEQRNSLLTISGSQTNISPYAFANCSSLTTASFPECTTIGSSAFANCYKLTSISFPSCTSIGGSAFANCSNLTTASLPECISIGTGAFSNCSKLSQLYIGTSNCSLANTNTFLNTPFSNSTYLGYFGSIYVPSDYVS